MSEADLKRKIKRLRYTAAGLIVVGCVFFLLGAPNENLSPEESDLLAQFGFGLAVGGFIFWVSLPE